MLYLIGTGLHDFKDMSLRAFEILEKCDRIFLENYTSPQNIDLASLEKRLGKKIQSLSREEVESSELIYKKNTALLVIGDPLVATTHQEIVNTAEKKGISVKIIHSSSIVSAICETGLHIYKFGKITSIPFTQKDFKPKSPCNIIKQNISINAHSLILLDIGMNFKEAIGFILDNCDFINEKTKAMVCADLGGKSIIISGDIGELKDKEIKEQPQVLIIPAEMHFTEEDSFNKFR